MILCNTCFHYPLCRFSDDNPCRCEDYLNRYVLTKVIEGVYGSFENFKNKH